MPNNKMLIDSISQHLTDKPFSSLDLKYAYSQLHLHKDTAKHCYFNIIC